MKFLWALFGLLFTVAPPSYAQDWTLQDSLTLNRLLQKEGKIELNPEALRELGVDAFLDNPVSTHEKSWLGFRADLPALPEQVKKDVVLTLHPYTPNTPYNWDPVLQKKIKIDKNTWKGAFYDLKSRIYPSDWAKHPLDAGCRNSLEKIEATGMRYVIMERVNNTAVGGWKSVGSGTAIQGLDLMAPFTKEFWNFKGRKRKKRTLEVLRTYSLHAVESE